MNLDPGCLICRFWTWVLRLFEDSQAYSCSLTWSCLRCTPTKCLHPTARRPYNFPTRFVPVSQSRQRRPQTCPLKSSTICKHLLSIMGSHRKDFGFSGPLFGVSPETDHEMRSWAKMNNTKIENKYQHLSFGLISTKATILLSLAPSLQNDFPTTWRVLHQRNQA